MKKLYQTAIKQTEASLRTLTFRQGYYWVGDGNVSTKEMFTYEVQLKTDTMNQVTKVVKDFSLMHLPSVI